ncbi:MAG: hypothetical protein IKA64_01890 [Clostridia bacterium]|nr:hypothetical protein [Clostridia bacterium]
MRVNELYGQVAQLGFEDSLESGSRFYRAVNRAVLEVNLLRPKKSSTDIVHSPPQNLISAASFVPVRHTDEDICYLAEGPRAYSFEVAGSGICHVERLLSDGSWEQITEPVEFPASPTFVAYRGFIRDIDGFVSGTVRLRFTGEYSYTLRGVSMYRELIGPEVSDIPLYSPFVKYRLRDIIPDFLALANPPISEIDGYDRITEGYEVEGGDTLLFPYDVPGCYRIVYKKLPRALAEASSPIDDESEIDLDEDLAHLLSLLVAVYNLAQDEPELANAYREMYRQTAAQLLSTEEKHNPIKIKDEYGWT